MSQTNQRLAEAIICPSPLLIQAMSPWYSTILPHTPTASRPFRRLLRSSPLFRAPVGDSCRPAIRDDTSVDGLCYLSVDPALPVDSLITFRVHSLYISIKLTIGVFLILVSLLALLIDTCFLATLVDQ